MGGSAREPGEGTVEAPRGAADFALDQMLLGLQRQADVLAELRQRAGMVLAATGIVTSLFGARALTGDYEHWLALVAISTTGLGMLACISVLWRVPDRGRLPRRFIRRELFGVKVPKKALHVKLPSPLWEKADGGERRWKVTLSWDELEEIAKQPATLDARTQVRKLLMARRVNYRTIKQRSWRFLMACWLLLFQLLAWAGLFIQRTWD